MVKNPFGNEGEMGLIPDPGRSHMLWSNEARAPQLLSLSTLGALLCNKSLQREAHTPQLENSPHLPHLEKVRTQQGRPSAVNI